MKGVCLGQYPSRELVKGYSVKVEKASGEGPSDRIPTDQMELRLIVSYSAYQLQITASNNFSTSPAAHQTVPARRYRGRRDLPAVLYEYIVILLRLVLDDLIIPSWYKDRWDIPVRLVVRVVARHGKGAHNPQPKGSGSAPQPTCSRRPRARHLAGP